MCNRILSIDIGTSSCKVIVYSNSGEAVAEEKGSYPLITARDGWVEQSPDVIFSQLEEAVIRLGKRTELFEIKAISICAQMSAQFLVDYQDQPITNLISWMDKRATEEVLQFTSDWTREEIMRITEMDMVITPAHGIPKLMWLKRHMPEQVEKSYKFVQIKDYIINKLTGKWVSDATSLKGFVKQDSGKPLTEILEYLDIKEDFLPQVKAPYEPAGFLKHGVWKECGLKSGIPIVTGWNDMNAAFLGMGALLEDGIGLDMTGTSEHLGWAGTAEACKPEDYDGINYVPFLDKKHIFYGVSSSAGLAINWYVKDFLQKEDVQGYMECVFGSEQWIMQEHQRMQDLLFIPYLEGERNPWNNPNARGVFWGINKFHAQAHMTAAVLEGICFELRAIYERMPYKPKRFIVSGGASRNAFWNQMKANILKRDIVVTNVSEAGCMGAEILAEKALEPKKSLEEIVGERIRIIDVFTPNQKLEEYYDAKYNKFLNLYKAACQLY